MPLICLICKLRYLSPLSIMTDMEKKTPKNKNHAENKRWGLAELSVS